jgi:hypothetical protein
MLDLLKMTCSRQELRGNKGATPSLGEVYPATHQPYRSGLANRRCSADSAH